MCRAYTLTKTAVELESYFGIEVAEKFIPRYNARPSQLLPAITQDSQKLLSFMYWGTIPSWSKNKTISDKLINVKGEAINNLVAYKAALLNRRCLIPADGYYVWKQISKRGFVPYRYTLRTNDPFYFAGIWEEFETEKGKLARTFVIITIQNNDHTDLAEPRLPMMVNKEEAYRWLNESDIASLPESIQSIQRGELKAYPVSPRINNPDFDDPQLIENTPPADQFGNFSLFD